MKQYIADRVAICPVCQISKTERVHYPGLLDPLHIPNSKWSELSMDFIEGERAFAPCVVLVINDNPYGLIFASSYICRTCP
jgi:hypothetical protein